VATAIHDGHELRPEVAELISLSDEERLREEDPFTGAWTAMAPTRIVVHRSRFEVDMNRPHERAVYIRPEDAWGLRVWRQPPPEDVVRRSRELHDAFYRDLRRILDEKVRRYGRVVVLDLHSYNHQRLGPEALFDAQSRHPDVNLGTGTMVRARWAPLVDRVTAELRRTDDLGRALDVRENVKFQGGAMTRWVHESYPYTACSLAIELKKFFMDEWTGQLFPVLHRGIGQALCSVAAAVAEELLVLRPAAGATE